MPQRLALNAMYRACVAQPDGEVFDAPEALDVLVDGRDCQASPRLGEHLQASAAGVVGFYNTGHAVHKARLLVHVLRQKQPLPLEDLERRGLRRAVLLQLTALVVVLRIGFPVSRQLGQGLLVALLEEDLHRQLVDQLGPASAAGDDRRLAPRLAIQLQDVPRGWLLGCPGAAGPARDLAKQLLRGNAGSQRRQFLREFWVFAAVAAGELQEFDVSPGRAVGNLRRVLLRPRELPEVAQHDQAGQLVGRPPHRVQAVHVSLWKRKAPWQVSTSTSGCLARISAASWPVGSARRIRAPRAFHSSTQAWTAAVFPEPGGPSAARILEFSAARSVAS